MFTQHQNFLSPELLTRLQEGYMRDDIKWTHRSFGRFFSYLDAELHDDILEHLYYNKELPTYHNKKMMRYQHMYLQRFVPGSWLPLHRERCYGVITIYINPDEDWSEDNPGPKFVYYNTQDLNNLEEHRREYSINYNTGTFYITSDQSGAPQYNPYHKVEYNKSVTSRYALQMFFGPSEHSSGASMTGDVSYKNHGYRVFDAHQHDSGVDQTARAIMSGALDVPDHGQMLTTGEEWKDANPEIIERLEQDG